MKTLICIKNTIESEKIISILNNTVKKGITDSIQDVDDLVDTLNEAKNPYNYVIADYEEIKNILNHVLANLGNAKLFLVIEPEEYERPIVKDFVAKNCGGFFYSKPIKVVGFLSTLNDILKTYSVDNSQTTAGTVAYLSIKFPFVRVLKKFPCDIFVKLSDDKYVKVFNTGTNVDIEQLNKYKEKGVKLIYVKSEDFDLIHEQMRAGTFVTSPADMKSVVNAHESLHEMVADLGITSYVMEQTSQVAKAMIDGINPKSMLGILFSMSASQHGFVYNHSYLTMLLCNQICQELDWSNASTREKLAMAAIVHDLAFTDPKLAEYDFNISDTRYQKLTKIQQQEITEHPKKLADALLKSKEVPVDIIDIVLKHHERPDGNGYPQKLSKLRVNQLEAIFIVGHHFVQEMYNVNFVTSEYKKILEGMRPLYSQGNYKGPYDAFEKFMLVSISAL